MRPGAALAAVGVIGLAGCSSLSSLPPGTGGAAAPSGESLETQQRPASPHLVAEGLVFDPASHDVDPDTDCERAAGRDVLESFDRAAWAALQVPAGDAVMTCGDADGAGWRHIADGHTGDFAGLADLVGAEWEDVAWFVIDRALEQPTRVEEYRDDIVNYDVLVEYVDGGRAERSWMVTVGVGLGSGQIITSFPDEQR